MIDAVLSKRDTMVIQPTGSLYVINSLQLMNKKIKNNSYYTNRQLDQVKNLEQKKNKK